MPAQRSTHKACTADAPARGHACGFSVLTRVLGLGQNRVGGGGVRACVCMVETNTTCVPHYTAPQARAWAHTRSTKLKISRNSSSSSALRCRKSPFVDGTPARKNAAGRAHTHSKQQQQQAQSSYRHALAITHTCISSTHGSLSRSLSCALSRTQTLRQRSAGVCGGVRACVRVQGNFLSPAANHTSTVTHVQIQSAGRRVEDTSPHSSAPPNGGLPCPPRRALQVGLG
jgi:hypothetical protein